MGFVSKYWNCLLTFTTVGFCFWKLPYCVYLFLPEQFLKHFVILWDAPNRVKISFFFAVIRKEMYFEKCRHLIKDSVHLFRNSVQFGSVQSSRSVMSNSLRPHELQHTRPPCPSPTPRVYSNSCPSSRWCHPAISSSVIPSPPTPNPSQHQGLF